VTARPGTAAGVKPLSVQEDSIMRFALLALAAATAALAAAPSQAADTPGGQKSCFRMSQVRSHRIVHPDTIYLRVKLHDVYRLTTKGSCTAAAMPDEALITRTVGGTDMVCRPLDLDISVRNGPGMASPCIVDSIARLTPGEIAALPKKQRP
jgi:hypothetical protein